MTRYTDLIEEALEAATWEGDANPLTELVRRLCDALETATERHGTTCPGHGLAKCWEQDERVS